MLKEWLLKEEGCKRHENKVSDSHKCVCVGGGGPESQPRPGPSPGIQTSDGLLGVKGPRVSAVFNTPFTFTLVLQGRKELRFEFRFAKVTINERSSKVRRH